jgi:hypothetical protein
LFILTSGVFPMAASAFSQYTGPVAVWISFTLRRFATRARASGRERFVVLHAPRNLGLAFVAVLVMAVSACNDSDLPPPGQFATVTGFITDRATRQPVAGAIVTVDTVLTATTDAAGKFTIEKVPAGTLDYTVKARDYKINASTVTATPGNVFTLDVALDRRPPG